MRPEHEALLLENQVVYYGKRRQGGKQAFLASKINNSLGVVEHSTIHYRFSQDILLFQKPNRGENR